jgi:hypothetical protein
MNNDKIICPVCDGRGKINHVLCPACGGRGTIWISHLPQPKPQPEPEPMKLGQVLGILLRFPALAVWWILMNVAIIGSVFEARFVPRLSSACDRLFDWVWGEWEDTTHG